MKTIKNRLPIVIALLLLVAITGCDKDLICVKGSGEVVTREVPMDAFDGVHLCTSADVELTQGEVQQVIMEGQADVLDNIKLVIKNGTWDIDNKKCLLKHDRVIIRITLPTLTEAKISGSGDMWTTAPFLGLDQLELGVTGSGDMDFEVEATTLETEITGSGNIKVAGTANSNDIHITGSGDIDTYDLPIENADVHITGSGNVEVTTSATLDVQISGSGDVYYKGTPTVDVKITGSGSVHNAN